MGFILNIKLLSCIKNGEEVSYLPYPGSKTPRTDQVSVMKTRPQLLDISVLDDALEVDVHEGSAIDVMIKDVGPLVRKSRMSEELVIAVKIYFEEDSDEDANDESDNDSEEDSDT
ncbi:hypothetical protein M9H77_11760 [Catharanthus roseus]|uniref:Uncharacterized protein n=1 Tax=Catharanthus roseus TaxID=4058 RepID=A0ACC0BFJ8_CATRO|nr:hypothetical protein M9H77_11760 [Catharanthus roseus]